MPRRTRLGACAIAAAWLGCTTLIDVGQARSAERPADGRLALTFHGDGAPTPGGVFPSKDAVHLRTQLAEGAAFANGDLAFVVVDARGEPVSTDALDCRRFRVERQGSRITEVYAGSDADGSRCRHGWGGGDGETLLPKLAPFGDIAPDDDGVMAYTVLVARVDQIIDGVFPDGAFRGTFLVAVPPKAPVCGDGEVGDGEECDDGNTSNGDGCSSTCKVEHEQCCEGWWWCCDAGDDDDP